MSVGSRRPNIVFILADDQGPWALGCAGNSEIRTPNLDRLAARGMRFENFFCASPVCSPARATLFTGRIPSQHGIHDWLREGNAGGGATEYLDGQTSYTDLLAEAGYRCGICGKWHLGNSAHPQKSFTHWYVHEKGGGPYHGAPMFRDGRLVEEPGYISDVITDEAVSFLDSAVKRREPFYLSIHYTAPHSPWIGNHPVEIVDSYDSCPFESCPQEPVHPWAEGHLYSDVKPRWRENLKGYFAATTAMDLDVGRILDRLESLGVRNDTLVVATSDNGFSCGHHGIWGKGNATFPLNMFENSVKVPFIASHPGVVPENRVNRSLVSAYDVFHTILDHAGVQYDSGVDLPGRSFNDVLTASGGDNAVRRSPDRESVVVYDEYGPVRMVRTADWKYVHRYPYGPHELYHLAEDPNERNNLADDMGCAEKRRELRDELAKWFHRYVFPSVDGAREPVTGLGQLGRAGPAGGGEPAFAQFGG